MNKSDPIEASHQHLLEAIQNESRKFQEYYLWLEKSMPRVFFEEVNQDNILLISHNLMGFHLQDFFSTINLKRAAIVMCLDSADADLRILQNYAMYGIKNYRAYVSLNPPPFIGVSSNLRVATIFFTEAIETVDKPFPIESKEALRILVKERTPHLKDEEFEQLIAGMNTRFLRSLSTDRLALALDMFFRAQTRDNCQYEVRYHEDWAEYDSSSMQIVLAWRNTPKHNFLYRMARIIHRHDLVMKRVNATYINPYNKNSTLIMALGLHGSNGQAAWDVANIPDFLRELVTVKYFAGFDLIDLKLVSKGIIPGTMGNVLRAMINFIHQNLVQVDIHIYNLNTIEEGLCRHPELTAKLCECIKLKFDPDFVNLEKFHQLRTEFLNDISKLDTGHEENDLQRKNILKQGISFITHTLKTNLYRHNYTALSFRLDPAYIEEIPFDRATKFPEMPYAIFFIKGMHFFGYHIRFKDLSRGGLRTVYPELPESVETERNNVFTECYNLALTQHKKNKDIPEGGSKGVIFLKPFRQLESEKEILQKELEMSKIEREEIAKKLHVFTEEQKIEYLYQAQRSFFESLLTLINCESNGELKAKYVIDYWKKPEYIYLGPDENMHDPMIQWIADLSKRYNYKPGSCVISGKPKAGINHKEYGVTSLGLNVYLEEILKYIGINPWKDPFTIKMSGGPDGDVAGNQICNLHHFFPKTAKITALTDISGTIYDPNGLDLSCLVTLFQNAQSIKYYPAEKLSEGGFLLDKNAKRDKTAYVQQTLCWKRRNGNVIEDWLSGSDMNHLLRHNVHQTQTDVFIPAGGRPRTLNEANTQDFLDEAGHPTSKIIIEGANLYLTPAARRFFEKLGTLIVKDSSSNKTGVICSSFEVLCGLTLGDDGFATHKNTLVKEILERIQLLALKEAQLLIDTHKQTGAYLTDISDRISESINRYTYEILDYLDPLPLDNDPQSPLIKSFLSYCLPTLRKHFPQQLLKEIPDHHKKAIIACHIASQVVYQKGLSWSPAIVDILPLLWSESGISKWQLH